MKALLVQPSAKVPLGGTSAGVPEPEGPEDGASEELGGGAASGEGEEGAGAGTAVRDGDGDGIAGAGAGVGDLDGGATTGAGDGVAVGETVGVAVGGNCAMIVVVAIAISIKSLKIVEEEAIVELVEIVGSTVEAETKSKEAINSGFTKKY
ncbi:hypothetical protein R6Q57_026210 [Mikania cordata]